MVFLLGDAPCAKAKIGRHEGPGDAEDGSESEPVGSFGPGVDKLGDDAGKKAVCR